MNGVYQPEQQQKRRRTNHHNAVSTKETKETHTKALLPHKKPPQYQL
jgi:hypothetical protein